MREVDSIEVIPATLEHAQLLAPAMRQSDVAEVSASGGFDPLQAVLASMRLSEESHSAMLDDQVLAIWGVTPMTKEAKRSVRLAGSVKVGAVWMLASHLVDRHPALFLRCCKPEVKRLMSRWDALVNAIDCRNERALRWARWLGFEIGAPLPFGVLQLPFRLITLRRDAQALS